MWKGSGCEEAKGCGHRKVPALGALEGCLMCCPTGAHCGKRSLRDIWLHRAPHFNFMKDCPSTQNCALQNNTHTMQK
eukprot:6145289-Amphidinium_carterae.1